MQCWRWQRPSCIAAFVLGVTALMFTQPVEAKAPDWLKRAARLTVPDYPEDTEAVMLWNEQITRVSASGELKTRYRRAYKILSSQGRHYGTATVSFSEENELTYFKAWSLPRGGKEYEVKEKEALESTPFNYAVYQDVRRKTIRIPAAEPGNVVGYEYEQKGRPYVLEDSFPIAQPIPVLRARLELELPKGWEFESRWVRHPEVSPQQPKKNRWVWELTDIQAMKKEAAMPHWRALASRLQLTFFPTDSRLKQKTQSSWKDVGSWYHRLSAPRRQLTAEIRKKVEELTVGHGTKMEEISALAQFVQEEVRYVAIEIGIGGYQPHSARTVFANRYGDCKDKATLLGVMLSEIGLDSYYVLAHSARGVVEASAPTAFSFNHVILAVRLPPDQEFPANLYATSDHETLGRLLFFDPTDSRTQLGYLPTSLQGSLGLLVTDEGGELVEIPLLVPSVNRLFRSGQFGLGPSGDLTGEVREIRWGAPALRRRQEMLRESSEDQSKVLEDFLAGQLGKYRLYDSTVQNLENYDKNLLFTYVFSADNYAQQLGDLMLLRPRVLGEKAWMILEGEKRTHPLEFPATRQDDDIFDISLPTGYEVDELPPPVELSNDYVEYRSEVEVDGNLLRFKRRYVTKEVWIPIEELAELKEFFRQVANDERSLVVLKRTDPIDLTR